MYFLRPLQEDAVTVNTDEAALEEDQAPPAAVAAAVGAEDQRPFAELQQAGVYAMPSDFIRDLIKALPADQKLTADQTLFMVRFAHACDEVWEDEDKPPEQRRCHHILLLGYHESLALPAPSEISRKPNPESRMPNPVMGHTR